MSKGLLIIPALALLAAAPTVTVSADPPMASPTRLISAAPSICRELGSHAQGEQKGMAIKRLAELPRGETYMAVYRTDEKGCIDPMLASERQR
jgi:hypothetical protein